MEAKNLLRQNFIQSDVGKSKAEVLAQRYGRAYGVNIIPVVRRVTSGMEGRRHDLFDHLDVPPPHPGENSLVIMCVDTAQARRDILSAWARNRMRPSTYQNTNDIPEVTPVFIDAGNEDDFGQVRIFQRARVSDIRERGSKRLLESLPVMRPEIQDIHCLPMDTDFYSSLEDNPGGSCADLDQTLAINALMATLIMGMVQNLYYLKPFTYHSMSISLSGGVSVEHLTAEYLIYLAVRQGKVGQAFGDMVLAFGTNEVIDAYRLANLDTLHRMGLYGDGTPMQAAPAAPAAESTPAGEEVPAVANAVMREVMGTSTEPAAEEASAETSSTQVTVPDESLFTAFSPTRLANEVFLQTTPGVTDATTVRTGTLLNPSGLRVDDRAWQHVFLDSDGVFRLDAATAAGYVPAPARELSSTSQEMAEVSDRLSPATEAASAPPAVVGATPTEPPSLRPGLVVLGNFTA